MDLITEIYTKYKEDVYNYLFFLSKEHDLSYDLLQETFIKVFLNILSFNSKSDIKTWIFSIARNTFIDHIRKMNLRLKINEENLILSLLDSKDIYLKIEDKDITDKIMNNLDDRSKKIVIKRIYGYSFKDIAYNMKISEASTRVIYHRAIKKMKNFVIENNFI